MPPPHCSCEVGVFLIINTSPTSTSSLHMSPFHTACSHAFANSCLVSAWHVHDTSPSHLCLPAQVAVLADLVTPLQHFRGELAAFPGLVDALKIGDQACAQLAAREAGAPA